MITEKLSGNAISYRRFSSIEQAQGDSLRRQKESFETFKERHDLEVLSEVEDLGKSAYHDEQFTKGGLGALVQAIEDEKVDVKSKPFYLIMESLDRYSRAHPHEALVSFLSLLNKGVNVITLSDQQLYKQKASPDSIMLALMQLSRANMESEIKSSRIKEAYAEKWKSYRNGVGRKLNSHPKWFKQVQIENSNEWRLEPIPEQVEVVKRIFEMSLVYGKPTICSILNEEGTLSFTGRKWKTSSIVNLFKNKRVLGQLDICTKQEDPETKRRVSTPTGEKIENFYPAIISETLFNKAQEKAEERCITIFNNKDHGKKPQKIKRGIGGRTGNKGNIFTGLLICIECGKNFSHYTSTYTNKKTGRKIVYPNCKCIDYANKAGCTNKPIRFDYLEKLFFKFIKEINFTLLFNNKNRNMRVNSIKNELEKVDAKKLEINQQIENLTLLSSNITTGNIQQIAKQIDEKNLLLQAIDNQEDKLKSEILEINESISLANQSLNNMCDIYKQVMQSDDFEQKHKLHNLIRISINGILLDGHNKYATILLNKNKLRKAFLSTLSIVDDQVVFDINPDDFSETFLVRFPVDKSFYEASAEFSSEHIVMIRNKMHPDLDYIHKINRAIRLNNKYYQENKYLKFGQDREEIEPYDDSVFDSIFKLATEQIQKLVAGKELDIQVSGVQNIDKFKSITDHFNKIDSMFDDWKIKQVDTVHPPHFILGKYPELFKIPEPKKPVKENPYYENITK